MQVSYFSMINKLSLHHRLEFNIRILVDSFGEGLGGGGKAGLSVGLTEHILALDTWDVSSIAWNLLSWGTWLLSILFPVKLFLSMASVTGN